MYDWMIQKCDNPIYLACTYPAGKLFVWRAEVSKEQK